MAGLLDKAKEFVAEKIAGMDKPTAEVKDGVRIKGVSRKEIKMETTVQIMNPYKHSLPICEVSYKLHSNERIIASGTVPDPGSLKACDTTDVTVPINVPYDFLFSLARDIGADWDIDYRIDLGLTIDLPLLGNFTIPLSHADTLKLPTLKDLF